MRILLTGSSGFIGINLLKKIENKHKIALIQRKKRVDKKFLQFNADIAKIKNHINRISNFKPDVLIHLAWEGIPDLGKKNSNINLKKQLIFFKDIKKIKTIKKIIVTGSCFEYGNLNGRCYEAKKISRHSPFSLAKLKIYKFVQSNFSDKAKIIWLRLFYVYGNHQRDDALIPYLIKQVKNNKKIFFKDPFSKRDFVNVDDVCSAIIKFIKLDKDGIYNVGTSKTYNPMEIIKIISKKIKKKYKIEYANKKPNNFFADLSKIKKCKWKPKISIEKGITRMIKTI